MDLAELSATVMQTYREIGMAQHNPPLRCPPGCGQCCSTPDMEATVREMLPMAFALWQQGEAEALYQQLQSSLPSGCVMFERQDPSGQQGRCRQYEHRPTLCRVFGVAATLNKYGERTLSLCRELKQSDPQLLASIDLHQLPLLGLGATQLEIRQPISLSLRIALEKVLLYQSLAQS